MENINDLILDIYDSSRYCPVSDFNEYALAAFNKTVEFNSAVIVDLAIRADRGFFIQSVHFHGTPLDRFTERQSVLGPEKIDENGTIKTHDLALKNAYTQRGKSVATDVEKTFSNQKILAYCRKYETAHSLTFAASRVSAGSISVLSFGRASRKNAFQKKHSDTADLLLPHILQARRINWDLNANIPTDLDSSSTALANFNGCLHFVEDKVVALLQLEWKQWTPPLLPRQLIDTLRQSKEKIFVGASICVKASVQGKMICLVIAPKNSRKVELSSAEYRVAQLAAKGLQYKEIARLIGVSPATIRNQLHAVYRKLGVSNKTALTNALAFPSFQEKQEVA
jgi:DNA-binding CsgD family transcriptional regulator